MTETEQPTRPRIWLRSPAGLALCAFLAIVLFFVLAEHRAHFFGALPWLLLLACPLLHLLHGGHGGHIDHAGHAESGPDLRQGDQS